LVAGGDRLAAKDQAEVPGVTRVVAASGHEPAITLINGLRFVDHVLSAMVWYGNPLWKGPGK